MNFKCLPQIEVIRAGFLGVSIISWLLV